MIIVRLRGGLGNQLFQYAAGISLGKTLKTEVKLDLYTYKRHTYRSFELDKFNIPFKIASRNEVRKFTGRDPFLRYFNKRTNYRYTKKVYSQPEYAYSDDFRNLSDPIYISGYWQSQRFFNNVIEEIQDYYTPKSQPTIVNQKWIDEMTNNNSVSIHVRHGDYKSNASYNDFFGILDIEYYLRAIEKISSSISNPKFYFFSDSIEWCKSEFSFLNNVEFLDNNTGQDAYWDMILMSKCKHNIIANSTFSWWGATLNRNSNKVVIAPSKWFNKNYFDGKNPSYLSRYYNTKDLIPDKWVKL